VGHPRPAAGRRSGPGAQGRARAGGAADGRQQGQRPRLEDEISDFDRKRTNNWAPGAPKDIPDAPIPRTSWDPAVAASQHLPAYVAASPGASTVAPGQLATLVPAPTAVPVPAQPSASYVASAPAAEVLPRGAAHESSLAVVAPTNAALRKTPMPTRHDGGRARRTTGVRHARTALGYSSGAGAQSAIIRLGLKPAAAARLGRLAERTVPADFQISSVERDLLNVLADRERLSARMVRELVGVIDAVAWMEALMAKLESYGLDLVQVAAALLIALDRAEQAPKLPSPNDRWFSALDELDEDRADQVLGEDLQQVAVGVAVDQHLPARDLGLVFADAGHAVEDRLVVVGVDVEELDRRALERAPASPGCRR
jgi:hypothetical protein